MRISIRECTIVPFSILEEVTHEINQLLHSSFLV